METDRLAVDLHRLGDRSVIGLRKTEIIVANQIELRILENNPTGLEKAEIGRVLGNQYNRHLSQQQDPKALSASKGPITADRREKNRRPRNRFEANWFRSSVEGRVTALKNAGARKRRSGNQEMPPPKNMTEAGASATSVEVRSTLRTSTVAYEKVLSTGLVTVRGEEPRRV